MLRRNARVSDPLLVTREYDVFFLIAWAIYIAWGASAAFAGIPTITLIQGSLYNTIWGGGVFAAALVAFLSCFSIFWTTGLLKAVTKKKIELSAAWLLAGIVSVYPMFLIISVVLGDSDRVATMFSSFLLLLVPIARIRHLTRRVKYYESLSL